jgi:hypothetical protein
METGNAPVDISLAALEDVIQKAAGDLLTARNVLARARAEMVATDAPVSRTVIADAERVIEHLRLADQSLTSVISKLSTRP